MSLIAILAVIYGLEGDGATRFRPSGDPVDPRRSGGGRSSSSADRARLESPLIDMSLFRIRRLNAALVTNLLGIFIAFGYFLFVAQYLQLVLGTHPARSGSVVASLCRRVHHRIERLASLRPPLPALVRARHFAGGGIGRSAGAHPGGDQQGIGLVVVGSVLISLALSPVFTLTTELVVGSAPPEKAGAASGISETGAELGGALGIAILGSIGAAVYRSGLDTLPAGLPSQAAGAFARHWERPLPYHRTSPRALGTSGARNGPPGLRPGTAGDGGGECGHRPGVGHPRRHAAARGAGPATDKVPTWSGRCSRDQAVADAAE